MKYDRSEDDYRLGIIGAALSLAATLFGMAGTSFFLEPPLPLGRRLVILALASVWLLVSALVLRFSLKGLRAVRAQSNGG